MDYAHLESDKILKKLERELKRRYRSAKERLEKEADRYIRQFDPEDKRMRLLVKQGFMTDEMYIAWRKKKLFANEGWNSELRKMSKILSDVDKESIQEVRKMMGKVYALNHNYGVWEGETQTKRRSGIKPFDEEMFFALLEDGEIGPESLKMPTLNQEKEEAWNESNILSLIVAALALNSARSFLKSRISKAALRNHQYMHTNARTMATRAENAGRQAAYMKFVRLGFTVYKEWVTTLDDRTREWHADMDGEVVLADHEFSNGLMYPGDPRGEPRDIYNCRCIEEGWVEWGGPGNEGDIDEGLDGMDYDDWLRMHED